MPRGRANRRSRSGGGTAPASPVAQLGSIVLNRSSLAVSRTAGDGALELEDTIVITNGGPGSLLGTQLSIAYDDAEDWLSLAIVSSGGVITATPTVDATDLSASTQTATVTVTDVGASNSGITFTIVLTVDALAGTMLLDPAGLTFNVVSGSAGTAQTIAITSSTAGVLATPAVGAIVYGAGETDWISSAIITGSSPAWTLTVTPTGVGVTAGGPYTATISISSVGATNTPQLVNCSLTAASSQTAILELTRSLDDARFTLGGSNPATQQLAINNVGTGSLAGPTVQSSGYSGVHSGWATPTITGNVLSVAFDCSGISTSGISFFGVTIADANAAATVTYTAMLVAGSPTVPAILTVSPTPIALGIIVGNNAPQTTVTLANGGAGSLGTLGASFTTVPGWVTANLAGSTVTLTFATTGLSVGTHSATLRCTSTLATNSPVDVSVSVIVSAAPSGNFPSPRLAQPPAGWVYNATLGYWQGSCFNDGLSGWTHCPNGEMPTFSGTVHTGLTKAQIQTGLANGTIQSNDTVVLQAGTTIDDLQLPARPGWSANVTNPFVKITTSGEASLPAYSYADGPASWDETKRGGKDSQLQFMATLGSNVSSPLDSSVIHLQAGAAGYLFVGIDFCHRGNTSVDVQNKVMELGARNGTAFINQTSAQEPQFIWIDRCRVRHINNDGAVFGIQTNCKYLRITHSTITNRPFRPAQPSLSYESKCICAFNSHGQHDILGNHLQTIAIGVLIGGAGNPSLGLDANTNDGMVMWNAVWKYDNYQAPDADDFKNYLEHKDGRRWVHAFNDCRYNAWNLNQKHGFLSKATSQSGGPFHAHTTDVLFWCNRIYHQSSAFLAIDDIFSGGGAGGAIGSERIEAAYNLHVLDPARVPTIWLGAGTGYNNTSQREGMIFSKANGDGVPGMHVYHNTFQGHFAFMTIGTPILGVAYSDVIFEDNVHSSTHGPCLDGPIRGNTANDTQGLNGIFGVGKWVFRRNLTLPGATTGAQWDATLAGGNNLNGYLDAGGIAGNFVDPANFNYSLLPGHTKTNSASDGTNPGYRHAMMATLLAGIVGNTS